MKSMFSLSIAVAALLAGPCAATNSRYISNSLEGRAAPDPSTVVYQGCYKSASPLTFKGNHPYQSYEKCQAMCDGMAVEATTNEKACWCGNSLPPKSNLVDDSQCNLGCNGYPQEHCGGLNTFSVYLTGMGKLEGSSSSSSSPSSSSSSTSSAPPSVVTVGGQTVVVTQPPTITGEAKAAPNKAAIAAGVVVGLVVLAGAAGGGFFLFMRRRRNRQVEEEYRRNAAVNEFVSGGKSHTSNSASFSDTRLDPSVMAQRRMSDGSIADNQDYSRRILKVTNA